MKDFLILEEEFEAKGFDQIATNVKKLVKFTADENQVANLQPAQGKIIEGLLTSSGTEIRVPHEAL